MLSTTSCLSSTMKAWNLHFNYYNTLNGYSERKLGWLGCHPDSSKGRALAIKAKSSGLVRVPDWIHFRSDENITTHMLQKCFIIYLLKMNKVFFKKKLALFYTLKRLFFLRTHAKLINQIENFRRAAKEDEIWSCSTSKNTYNTIF